MIESGKHSSPARQAVESAPGRYEQFNDKHTGNGLVSVTIEGLRKTKDLISQLREELNSQQLKLDVLDKLEKALDDMVVK